jgi:ankyrin repeat protein
MRHFDSQKEIAAKISLFLVKNGADLSIKNKNGFTCLH